MACFLGWGAYANEKDSTKTEDNASKIKEVVSLHEMEHKNWNDCADAQKKFEVRIINLEGTSLYSTQVKSLDFIENETLKAKLKDCDFVMEIDGIAYYLKAKTL